MRIKVINPNTTASMTAKIGAAARDVAADKTEIVAVSPAMGPVSIEGYFDEAVSVLGYSTRCGAARPRAWTGT
jgi:allantoin racemase